MQVAVGPLRQFGSLATAVAPGMKDFAEMGEKALAMMICHRYI
jgi:hypothetical protein